MPFNPDSSLQAEIATQPDDWARVVSRVGEMHAALPAAGARLAVVGCGTSFYMAQAFAALREQAGQGETDAFAASEHKLHRGYDAVLVITRSGTTTEVIDVLTGLRGSGVPTTAIVATAGTPVTELADTVILLSEVDEESVVQTRFATTALALLRASLGEDLTAAVADARAVLAEDEAHGLAGLVDAGQLSFLGRGWTVGLAEEAGLKLRESAQLWTESYPAMEYRHGPISIAARGTGDVGVRRGAGGAGRPGPGHRCPLRAPRHRPDGRPRAGAPAVPGQGPPGRRGPRPPSPPEPLHRPHRRRRARVALPPMQEVVAAVDVGGTRIKAALVDRSYDVVAALTVPTPADIGADIGSTVASAVGGLLATAERDGAPSRLVGCGVVVPGLVDERRGVGVWSANLGWRDLPVRDAVAARLQVCTVVGHDVRAGLLAETRLGAARGARHALFLPVGTGIAGALLLEGVLVSGDGWAGELGHMVIDPAGPPCACGAVGLPGDPRVRRRGRAGLRGGDR